MRKLQGVVELAEIAEIAEADDPFPIPGIKPEPPG